MITPSRLRIALAVIFGAVVALTIVSPEAAGLLIAGLVMAWLTIVLALAGATIVKWLWHKVQS